MSTAHQTRKARLAMEKDLKASEAPTRWVPPGEPRLFPDGLTQHGHPGQCKTCGAFRIDCDPPTVHRTGCPVGPDGLHYGEIPQQPRPAVPAKAVTRKTRKARR